MSNYINFMCKSLVESLYDTHKETFETKALILNLIFINENEELVNVSKDNITEQLIKILSNQELTKQLQKIEIKWSDSDDNYHFITVIDITKTN